VKVGVFWVPEPLNLAMTWPAPGAQPDPDLPETFTMQLLAELRARIADGRLAGRMPSEPAMAELYGVSRWVLREAIEQLKDKGLITSIARRGTWVVLPGRRPSAGA
jgi:GntR family transcriptional repressor for pyruvate dehydrogenase complex